jgi:hypothetical protein
VPGRGVIVEQLLQRRAAETGAATLAAIGPPDRRMMPAAVSGAMYLISSLKPAGTTLGSAPSGSLAVASESCDARTERSLVSNPAPSKLETARWKWSRSGNDATASRTIGKDADLGHVAIDDIRPQVVKNADRLCVLFKSVLELYLTWTIEPKRYELFVCSGFVHHQGERRRCDLIVMASHGCRGVSAVVLGSETVKVLTHSKIPVLVYC